MTRRPKRSARKKGGGVLLGMRQGVQKVAGAVSGTAGDADDGPGPAARSTGSRVWGIVSNLISGALILVAGAVLLKKCGILRF